MHFYLVCLKASKHKMLKFVNIFIDFFLWKEENELKTILNESQKLLKTSSATVRLCNESQLIMDKLFLNKFILFWEKSR